MRLTYFPTHTRMTPWIIGIMFAYILHRQKDKRVNFNIVRWSLHFVSDEMK